MIWGYIRRLLGPGLYWHKTQLELRDAIDKAEKEENFAAAEHLRIILELRNSVMFEDDAT